MLFSSIVFIFGFLPASWLGFCLAARAGRQVTAVWLIFVSLVFYGWWNPTAIILLVISICTNYGIAMLILRTEAQQRLQSWIMAAGVCFNLGALFYYKYLFAVIDFLAHIVPAVHAMDPIVLPLGISFFSFTQIGYLVDCKAGVTRDRDFLNYSLFVTFFPHLIAGPILHNRDIMPQFADPRTYRVSIENLGVGISIFVMGLVKKTVFADPLSGWVAAGYAHTDGIGWMAAWNVALCYSLQLYFDFSGYSDMAIGLARMMNIRFPRNFESPYKAQNVIEYWQRWHITLTKFLTSYVYTPLAMWVMRWRIRHRHGVNRAGQRTAGGFVAMIAVPLVVTMALAGIWHGSGLTFVIFGLMHGGYLCINHAIRVFHPGPRSRRLGPTVARCGLTYLSVLAASVFFRAPLVSAATQVLAGMAGVHGFADAAINRAGVEHALHLALLYLVVWFLPNTQQIMSRYHPVLGEVEAPLMLHLTWNRDVASAVAIGVGASLGILALGGTTEFLYFQF